MVAVEVKVPDPAERSDVIVNVPGDVELEIIFNTTLGDVAVKHGPDVHVNVSLTDPAKGDSDIAYRTPKLFVEFNVLEEGVLIVMV